MTDKPDVTLSDGRGLTIDKSALTIKEWRRYWNVATPDSEVDATLAKVTGLKVEEISALLFDDFKRLSEAFRKKCSQPLSDEKN